MRKRIPCVLRGPMRERGPMRGREYLCGMQVRTSFVRYACLRYDVCVEDTCTYACTCTYA